MPDHDARKDHPDKQIELEVNGRTVTVSGKTMTGMEIKQAAIAQGASIQDNFVLQQELANGSSVIVGDADIVHLRPHLKFTAIAPDDNS